MKKLVLTLVFSAVVVAASFHAQIKSFVFSEKAINKNISLNVSAGSAYQSKIYTRSAAKLQLVVFKITGNETEQLWEQNYPTLKLSKFPTLTHMFHQTIFIPGVFDSKEQIVIQYTVTYQTKEDILTIKNVKWVVKGQSKDQLNIII